MYESNRYWNDITACRFCVGIFSQYALIIHIIIEIYIYPYQILSFEYRHRLEPLTFHLAENSVDLD